MNPESWIAVAGATVALAAAAVSAWQARSGSRSADASERAASAAERAAKASEDANKLTEFAFQSKIAMRAKAEIRDNENSLEYVNVAIANIGQAPVYLGHFGIQIENEPTPKYIRTMPLDNRLLPSGETRLRKVSSATLRGYIESPIEDFRLRFVVEAADVERNAFILFWSNELTIKSLAD